MKFPAMSEWAATAAFVAISAVQSVTATDCGTSNSSGMTHRICRQGETCCGAACCPASGHFYTHWYFWLAVSMFLALVLVFVVSACCHYRRERKYNRYYQRGQNKPELQAEGAYINYHMTLSDTVTLPLYEELEASGALARDTVVQVPPPPYCDSNSSSSDPCCTGTSLPPSYSQAILMKQT